MPSPIPPPHIGTNAPGLSETKRNHYLSVTQPSDVSDAMTRLRLEQFQISQNLLELRPAAFSDTDDTF
eukprot:1560620-Rhodomonas_salina.1